MSEYEYTQPRYLGADLMPGARESRSPLGKALDRVEALSRDFDEQGKLIEEIGHRLANGLPLDSLISSENPVPAIEVARVPQLGQAAEQRSPRRGGGLFARFLGRRS